MDNDKKVCFVIMGFGKKVDYESGRILDLDATYEAIIKPAAIANDFRCIRADEIAHSGVIDVHMYEMLLRADLVIADISTGNVNAVYELGVRHALRPFSTIIMKEAEGRLQFDLNHVSTFNYEHLGKDIGAREAARAKHELEKLIQQTQASPFPDSPVYTYLPKLKQPLLTKEEYEDLLDEAEAAEEHFSSLLRQGESALAQSSFDDAVIAFTSANAAKAGDAYIIQKLALSVYKSEKPSTLDALISAIRILDELRPDHSNDPETLGISGAIRKRIWFLSKDPCQLDSAIKYYRRGYEVTRDYYNGENLATCYELRSGTQKSTDEAQYDRMSARKIRTELIDILLIQVDSPAFQERSDRKWIYATLANCFVALSDKANADKYQALFYGELPASWEAETYEKTKQILLEFIANQ